VCTTRPSFLLRWSLVNFLPQLLSSHYPPNICLPSSWDYRYESLYLTYIHVTFIRIYYYNCSNLLLVIVNLLLCLSKLCMYKKTHSLRRVWYYLQFQASIGGLGIVQLWIKGNNYIYLRIHIEMYTYIL
jgi:hypothetical protein